MKRNAEEMKRGEGTRNGVPPLVGLEGEEGFVPSVWRDA